MRTRGRSTIKKNQIHKKTKFPIRSQIFKMIQLIGVMTSGESFQKGQSAKSFVAVRVE